MADIDLTAYRKYELAERDWMDPCAKFYLASEVDNLIAEKDETIAELKEQVSEERSAKVDYKISANDLGDGLKAAYKEIDHQRYKRCFDKTKWCDERIARYTLQQEIQGVSWQKEIAFYRRLKDKYIEISKRFKEVRNG